MKQGTQDKQIREAIRKEIKNVLNEAFIDPWAILSDILQGAHETRRNLFDQLIKQNIFPDEETGVQIKNAYSKAKDLEELLNSILPKYQDMSTRED